MTRRTMDLFMRKAAIALFLLITPVLTLAIQHSDAWIKYTSKEGRYSVMLPAQPSLDSQQATSAGGEKFTQYKATVNTGNVVYMVAHFDSPPSTVFAFDTARDRMMEGVKATLLSDRSLSLGGVPGREVRLLMKISGDEYLMIARFYDLSGRVYLIQLITPKSDEAAVAEKAARYFDSFQVVKTPQ
jgi:hypothetical protein